MASRVVLDVNASSPSTAPSTNGTPTVPYTRSLISYRLADGPAPEAALADQLTILMGEYVNCRPLAAASLSTVDLLLRQELYYAGGGWFLVNLFRDSQTPGAGQPIQFANAGRAFMLFDWRMLDDDHVGAYIGYRYPNAQNYTIYGHFAYVAFVRGDDGKWRIDDLRLLENGECGFGSGSGWCNP